MDSIKKKQVIDEILVVMKCIADTICNDNDGNPYTQQYSIINNIFTKTSNNYDTNAVILRLVVIDSLYSTNASYSYFSFENMAKAIREIGSEDDVLKYFDNLMSRHNDDDKGIFSSRYGIRKNLGDGSKQMSLMTKYAYYQMMQKRDDYPLGFPIYDSLVVEVYPQIYYHIFGCEKKTDLNVSIEQFIESLNVLRKLLFEQKKSNELVFGMQQYNLLDAYLWRIGKINKGNYSLLLDENDYNRFITNIGLSCKGSTNYGNYLFEKFKDKKYQGKQLIKCVISKNPKNIQYKYDFNTLVRYQCANMPLEDILCGINNNRDVIIVLMKHWIELFSPKNDYIKIDK